MFFHCQVTPGNLVFSCLSFSLEVNEKLKCKMSSILDFPRAEHLHTATKHTGGSCCRPSMKTYSTFLYINYDPFSFCWSINECNTVSSCSTDHNKVVSYEILSKQYANVTATLITQEKKAKGKWFQELPVSISSLQFLFCTVYVC